MDKNFFFEKQLNNPDLTWELLAQPWSKEGNLVQDGLCTEKLIRGIIQDSEFGVTGSHDFSGPGGFVGDVGNLVNGFRDKFNQFSQSGALITGAGRDLGINDEIDGALNKVEEWSNDFSTTLGKIVHKVRDMGNQVGSTFVTAFDFVKVFKGTQLEFEFPPFEARIYNRVYDDQSVTKKLESLIKRFVGGVYSTDFKALDNLIGIQNAPNGFLPSFKMITANEQDNVKGTFTLRFGQYKVPNLLVTSFGFRVSTMQTRSSAHPYMRTGTSGSTLKGGIADAGFRGQIDHGDYGTEVGIYGSDEVEPEQIKGDSEPLYVDVRFTVQPCTYIARSTLINLLTSRTKTANTGEWNGSQKVFTNADKRAAVRKSEDFQKSSKKRVFEQTDLYKKLYADKGEGAKRVDSTFAPSNNLTKTEKISMDKVQKRLYGGKGNKGKLKTKRLGKTKKTSNASSGSSLWNTAKTTYGNAVSSLGFGNNDSTNTTNAVKVARNKRIVKGISGTTVENKYAVSDALDILNPVKALTKLTGVNAGEALVNPFKLW